MLAFTLPDDLALGWFIASWIVYSLIIEKSGKGTTGLNALMNHVREDWMGQMISREVRIVDSQVTAALQNGTAFFASTSLIAIGGTLSLLRASEQILTVIAALPLSVPTTPAMWELKVVGLAVVFVYAFFKFAWSYRLFNYLAIMIGAAPPSSQKDTVEAKSFVHRASQVCAEAGLHFNRGQRAFFFALGYLGWFLGPAELALSTTAVLVVMWRRQFASPSRQAFEAKTSE